MNTHKILSTAISKSLPKPLAYLQTQIADSIQALVQYSPTIGLMGKTGAGKSSLLMRYFSLTYQPLIMLNEARLRPFPFEWHCGNAP
ncbi:hypothetical protein ABN075_19410 [Providencia rettgeri]